jgi:tartrate dehydrogenase/decarboxylase/D-malate dehydrogenase
MSTKTWRIAVIPGDGIGKEVIPQGLRVLAHVAEASAGRVAFEYEFFPWGCEYYLETGRMMDADGLQRLEAFDAIYFGAVGWPGVPDHVSLLGLLLPIRQTFDQYACIRPTRLLPGIQGPLRNATPETLDFIVVRENTEGEYADIGGRVLHGRGLDHEVAVQSSIFTAEGCERIMRFAFDLARTRKRKKVTSATKSNSQQHSMVLWDAVFRRVAADYPDVETEQWLIDALSARFVLRPETFEVVVSSNLFGDILSDLASALAGSLGIAASANLNPTRRSPSMFEPVHGSAPDIAGKGIANPIAAIWSAALMLEHLGMQAEAADIMTAIETTTAAGRVTADLGGTLNTIQVGDAILQAMHERITI